METSTNLNQENNVLKTSRSPNEKASIVIIESNSVCRTLTPKDLSLDTLYKKGGFINNDNFSKIHTWDGIHVNGDIYNSVSIWGKLVGKSNNINKFLLPTPLDKHKLFGACIVVHSDAEKILSIDANQWKNIYDSLSSSSSSTPVNSNVCISDNNNGQPQLPTIKNSKPNKRGSKLNTINGVDSNCTDVSIDTLLITTSLQTTKPKSGLNTTSASTKLPIKRNKKKPQDTDLNSADIPLPYRCELSIEKYVFTDEE